MQDDALLQRFNIKRTRSKEIYLLLLSYSDSQLFLNVRVAMGGVLKRLTSRRYTTIDYKLRKDLV